MCMAFTIWKTRGQVEAGWVQPLLNWLWMIDAITTTSNGDSDMKPPQKGWCFIHVGREESLNKEGPANYNPTSITLYSNSKLLVDGSVGHIFLCRWLKCTSSWRTQFDNRYQSTSHTLRCNWFELEDQS